jgi:5-methylcytosine-specific restriction endonuclease McrA
MFAKTIVLSDAFLDMPMSSRCLYFAFGMFADDDGFVNAPKSIMRQVGASLDDMNILLAKKYIIIFENGVVVIKHWHIHNYIQKDRYIETKYKEEKAMLSLDENNAYTMSKNTSLIEQKKPLSEARQKRSDARRESDLPYSFDYKIRAAFVGEKCPICGCTMDYSNNLTKPTIQHNVPISKGGKHELDNISVICASCNKSIINRYVTPELNNAEVKKKWREIGNVSGMDTQDRLD